MEEFPSLVVHVTQGEKSCAGSYKGKCTKDDNLRSYKHVKKETKFGNFNSCLEMAASSLSTRVEKDLAKAKKYKETPNQATSLIHIQLMSVWMYCKILMMCLMLFISKFLKSLKIRNGEKNVCENFFY